MSEQSQFAINIVKMNLASISQFVVGIYPYQDYNETVYCLKNAIRKNELKRCTNISGFYTFEHFPLFVFQVIFTQNYIQIRYITQF
jgi:hypothetical protein